MDPLSIAASITALVATARKVYGVLSGLTSSIVNAPESVRATLATVSQMKSALIEVQQLIQAVDTLPSTRKALIRLDHIAITFSQCVIVLTKLESLVCHAEFRVSAESNGTGKFATRLRWAFSEREKKVSRLLPQLEAQKSCLTLMVSVLRCQSDIEAVRDRDRLQDTLDMVLQQNESLASRLESLETSLAGDDDRSVRFLDNSSAFDLLDDADSASIQSTLTRPRGSKGRTAGSSLMGFARPFEATLMSSWVYGRVRPTNECDNMSVSSYTLRSKSWSMLSGLSLNDISAIAVFRLPMTINDISRISPDSTFGKMMSGGSERPLPVLVPVTGRREMKVVVVGDPGVNKTRLIHTYVTKRLPNGGQQLLSTVLEQYITTTT
ncbi:hypothetical protein B0T17DRAFT_220633 [Bombardia bombarda]|uniref:Fungal N-terminal domain-containing protein n=1 Tax=Bombardia bombarda TaxID=252184 RepID=A0AA39XB50_9PEZI|nr:hypothetical protein B0T17DRAFT_220633 [Bombardia bombarda]